MTTASLDFCGKCSVIYPYQEDLNFCICFILTSPFHISHLTLLSLEGAKEDAQHLKYRIKFYFCPLPFPRERIGNVILNSITAKIVGRLYFRDFQSTKTIADFI